MPGYQSIILEFRLSESNSFILPFNSRPGWSSTAVNPNECTTCKKKHQLKLLCFHFCHTQVFAGLKTVRRMKIYPNLINLISYFQRHFFSIFTILLHAPFVGRPIICKYLVHKNCPESLDWFLSVLICLFISIKKRK